MGHPAYLAADWYTRLERATSRAQAGMGGHLSNDHHHGKAASQMTNLKNSSENAIAAASRHHDHPPSLGVKKLCVKSRHSTHAMRHTFLISR